MEKTAGKPIRCRAAVCRATGEALVMEEIEVAPPKAYEVRIKILCTSLCHTDVTLWKMPSSPISIFPRIFGHEAVGVVESVGENVTDVKEGETVVPVFLANCEDCRDCKSKKSNMCTSFPFSAAPGVGAAWKVADVEAGSTVAIFGLGAVGLAVAEGARIRGVSKIIGVDLNPEKFDTGKKFGVTDFVNPKECGDKSVSEVIKEITDGGADYCFECVGLASVMNDAFTSCRDGWGKTIVLGAEMHGAPLSINTYELLRGKSIEGSLFGGIKAKTDIPLLAQSYLNKELQLDEFITHEINFEEINTAFDLLSQGKSLRCIIWMD
ncbi:alcohol dehydrogenase-like 2 isoform X2 [Papaver somniferum]|uniref:alcohol dehydrogenase-like 2 isoform X2 n=1 Tax=Papaver somniferum TaxID=3469 RepID=UPI000E6FD283|nr:alcohol dehydrogenase-like 2 isoform X2 [Papaver somniferum]